MAYLDAGKIGLRGLFRLTLRARLGAARVRDGEAELRRLAETSPHLLCDVGVAEGHVWGAPSDDSPTLELARRILSDPACAAGRR